MAHDILIIDDEQDIRTQLQGLLNDEGYDTRTAATSNDALTAFRLRIPSLVILDIWLGQKSPMDGLDLLADIKKDHPDLPVLMISGHGTIETAVSALKKGAYDYVEKPFKTDRLLTVISRALETAKLKKENAELRQRGVADFDFIGSAASIQQLRTNIEKIAPTNSRVMILGAPGSGKETVARLVHSRSKRAHEPFVALNCALITPDKMEVELFGTEPGYIVGQPRKVGLFEQSHKGTLFFDEITDMPMETQGKILRVLLEQKFTRLGGDRPVEVDIRVIASSGRDCKQAIADRKLREDLYYRLSVVPLTVPSLKERRDDIINLFQYFIQRAASISGLPARHLASDALSTLQAYAWPGNVRQLRNVVEWLLIMAPGTGRDPITAEMLPPDILGDLTGGLVSERPIEIMTLPLREARESFEREYLLAQIARFNGNISHTASFIGMERSALHRKMRGLGISAVNDRDDGKNQLMTG